MFVASKRLVLCPYGIAPQQRKACTELLLRCGGDPTRLIDSPAQPEAFLSSLSRLSGTLAALRPPIVLLTALTPIVERVMLLRDRYETQIPELCQADWLLFVNGNALGFVAECQRFGELDGAQATPIWVAPDARRYPVLTPDTTEDEIADALWSIRQAGEERGQPAPRSGVRLTRGFTRSGEVRRLDGSLRRSRAHR